jgi:hypothetical protein
VRRPLALAGRKPYIQRTAAPIGVCGRVGREVLPRPSVFVEVSPADPFDLADTGKGSLSVFDGGVDWVLP